MSDVILPNPFDKGTQPRSVQDNNRLSVRNPFEEKKPDNRKQLDSELKKLLMRDWKKELRSAGFEESQVLRANVLLGEFVRGVVDTINGQIKRNLISQTYVLPEVKFGTTSQDSGYDPSSHIIYLGIDYLSSDSNNSPIDHTKYEIAGTIVFEGTYKAAWYFLGTEESKHSVEL